MELIEKEADKKVNVIHGKSRLGDVRRNFSDITKAKEKLGYIPDHDIKKGLTKTFEYFNKAIRPSSY